jgi:L-aspartate oxidase
LSLQHDLISVRPAAHYLMGGVRTDLSGRTTLAGLYAAGEAACTGVHGANRLASNSLLEGLVFGARAAEAMLADGLEVMVVDGLEPLLRALPDGGDSDAMVAAAVTDLRTMMWRHAGLLRDEALLRSGLASLEEISERVARVQEKSWQGRGLLEAQSLLIIARAILLSALAREESRGAHFREDFPRRDDDRYGKHSIECAGEVRFEAFD